MFIKLFLASSMLAISMGFAGSIAHAAADSGDEYGGALFSFAAAFRSGEREELSWDQTAEGIGDDIATELAGALKPRNVTALNLSFNPLGNEGVRKIAEALPGSNLKTLGLAWNRSEQILVEGVCAIAEVLPRSALTSLDLSKNSMIRANSYDGVVALAEALRYSVLLKLNLRETTIGNEGARILAEGLRESRLRSLVLSMCSIGDEGALAIAEALPSSNLNSVEMDYNSISDRGVSAIAEALPRSPNLTKLSCKEEWSGFSELPISESSALRSDLSWEGGACALAEALPGSQLTSLCCSVSTEDGVRAITVALQSSPLLTSLHCTIKDGQRPWALAETIPRSELKRLHLEIDFGDFPKSAAKTFANAVVASKITSLEVMGFRVIVVRNPENGAIISYELHHQVWDGHPHHLGWLDAKVATKVFNRVLGKAMRKSSEGDD